MYFLSAICLFTAAVSRVVLASPMPQHLSAEEIAAMNLEFHTQYGQIINGRDTCIAVSEALHRSLNQSRSMSILLLLNLLHVQLFALQRIKF